MSSTPLQQHDVPTWLTARVAECLNVPAHEITPEVPLARLGLDSIAALQLTAAIAEELGCAVPEGLLLAYPDMNSLARYLEAARTGGDVCLEPRDDGATAFDCMLADSILPPDVRPALGEPWPRAVRSVLVTGVTGFLGAYLLRSLLRGTQTHAFCLVRPGKVGDPRARVRQNLESHGIWEPSFEDRIHPFAGNLLRPGLDLPADQFDALCRDVDEVYHCAAAVNWVFPYEHLRETNVLGTLGLLWLACRYRPKPFHFVSSLGACFSTCGPTEVSEDDDLLPYLGGVHLGYPQSKCVAEALVRQAGERGLPVRIYRPSLIGGDTHSGISSPDDFLAVVIGGCIRMKAAPDLDWALDCCPVDHVAEAIAGLAHTSTGPLHVYHLASPDARHWRELVLWMNLFGYPMRLIPYLDWLAQMEAESRAPEHPLHPLRAFFLNRPCGAGGLTLPQLYEEGRRSRISQDRTRQALAGLALRCPPLDVRLLDRYFRSWIDRDVLPPVARPGPAQAAAAALRLDRDFFSNVLRSYYGDRSLQVQELTALPDAPGKSIIGELTSWRRGAGTGLSRYRLVLDCSSSAVPAALEVFVKVKAKDEQVMEVGKCVAELCGREVGAAFSRFKLRTGLAGCHLRELAVYGQADDRFRRHAPVVFGTVRDDERQHWVLVLESLSGVVLLDSADDVRGWRRRHVEAAVRGLALVHSIWYGREAELIAQPWLGPTSSAEGMVEMSDLWTALAQHSARYFTEWVGSDIRRVQEELIARVGAWWRPLEEIPRTLIHNDFNPRNLALRPMGHGLRLCAYDWELATLGVPQHDLAELLCFVLTPEVAGQEVLHYLEVHRRALERAAGRAIGVGVWQEGFQLALCDLILNRLPMYCLMHTLRRQQYLERVLRTWRTLHDYFVPP